ncbi:hypothetical protein [Cytobacillus oceanisediminis]|uniref:hypothetical protein n=1 Tax=Cytobacillus oceanisediminis TaxID=665099 RepID=UPI00207A7C10|nr:hypothetical protein [Cytobacillus oceanisediminis]USK42266.1 hypothetical protein LIT27_16665 [Cytobacillus oceanisediminis]
MLYFLSFIFALGFTLIHFFSKYMSFIKDVPRSRVLSFAGGVAVSYVFLHLLPELSNHQEKVEGAFNTDFGGFLKNHIYVIALIGLAVFYGLERMVKTSKRYNSTTSPGVFWLHISSFFIYNALIGYLLVREEYESIWGMVFYFLALGIHFITNDRSLRRDHQKLYDKYGRVSLALAILIGWGTGTLYKVDELVISFIVAFLAGGIVLNVLKEELPEEKQSRFSAFVLGLTGYTLLLVLI